MRRLKLIALVVVATSTLAGCNPLVVGAGGAVVADSIAEDRGGNLF